MGKKRVGLPDVTVHAADGDALGGLSGHSDGRFSRVEIVFRTKIHPNLQSVICRMVLVSGHKCEQVDLMETKFKEFMSNENERLERDVKAADDRSAAVSAERAALRRAEWQAICESRQQQLGARADRKRQEALDGQAFAEAWKVCSYRAWALPAVCSRLGSYFERTPYAITGI